MAKLTNEKIVIHFEPKGDAGLIRAITALDRATVSMLNTQANLVAFQKSSYTATEKGKAAYIRLKNTMKSYDKTLLDVTKDTKLLAAAQRGDTVAIMKLSRATRKYTRDLDRNKVGILGTGHAARQTGGAFSVLRSQLLLVNFALALGVRQMINMVTASAKVESMEKAFTTLAGATDNSAIALMKLKQATNDTMSEFDLFKQANNAMILGVTRNSDEMAEMFDVAQRLGRALGQDTASSVESLITGIGRQSRLMLDNIGIIVRSEEAYQAYADKLNITVDELSDADKKQAFLNATMEAARQKVQTLGKETLTTQDTFDKLGAASADLAKEIGKALSPVFSTLAKNTFNVFSNLTQLISIFNHTKGAELQLIEATNKAESSIEKLSAKYGIAIDNSKGLVTQLKELQSNTKLAKFRKDELRITILKLTDAQALYAKSIKDGETAGEADKKFKAAKAELKAIDDSTAAEQKAFQEATDKSAKRNFLQEQALKIMQANEKKRVKARKETLKELTRLEKEYHQRQKDVQSQADDQRKAVQDRAQSENEAFLNNINSSIGAVGDFLSAWQSNMKSRMDTEISTLKDSEAYKMADTERRKDMERQITKGYAAEQMKQFRIGQATAIADIGMSTASALMKSVAGSWVTIGQPWAGIIATLGLAQAGMVLAQKPPSFEQGGLVGGQRHSQGGTMIEAEQGEFIMSRSAVSSIGTSALNQMNQGGGGGITLNISAPLIDEHILDTIIPAIQKAQRMNLA